MEENNENNVVENDIVENETNNIEENNITENNEEVIKKFSRGSYLRGTIGAILGAAVASLPWILVYVYGNMIVALLAILIALGAFQGYKIFKGKMGKPVPVIITIISIVMIVLLTMIICPLVILSNEGLNVSLKMIQKLYRNSEVIAAIVQDLLISLLFTVVGIAGTIKSINMQIKSGSQDIKFSEQPLLEEFKNKLQEAAVVVKNVFESLNALSEEKTVAKNEVINELIVTYNLKKNDAKAYFQYLYNNEVIKKVKGKYYYDVENEEEKLKNATPYKENKRVVKISLVILFIVIIAAVIIGVMDSNSERKVTLPNTATQVTLTSDLYIYDTYEEIASMFGEEYARYYDFAVWDNKQEAEIYGIIVNKEDIEEEYTLQELVENDRVFAEKNYNDVSEIKDRTMGKTQFKSYTYSYGSDVTYLGNLFITDLGDAYLYVDCYTDLGNQAKIDEMMNTLFK